MIKVLIIEDKQDNLKIIKDVLDSSQYTTHYSHDKKDGVEIAIHYKPDLILFHFGGFDDLVYLNQILNNDATAFIPLLIIPIKPSFEDQRVLMELGVADYLPEQFIESSLLKTIVNLLGKIRKLKQSISEQMETFEEIEKSVKQSDHLLVKLGTKLKLIKFSDILCITALKEYSKIKTNDNFEILVRKSMRNWVKMLPSNSFLRIHRATIININYIDKISQNNGRTYTVSLKGAKDTFDFSYRYANIMRRSFPT
ncbi:MAG: response regulator transcription factor [Ignavibacteriaceae bacterium]|nr:response regulator transcription factor [Ignavibacteriaceae bacterium]